jgi:primosomal protein N'
MKSLFVLLALLYTCVQGFSQAAPQIDSAKTVQAKKTQNAAAWACPACYKITREGGNCADDKTAKIQLGTYYCQHCVKASGDKPGQCPMCKGATTQITRKLCREHKDTGKRAA